MSPKVGGWTLRIPIVAVGREVMDGQGGYKGLCINELCVYQISRFSLKKRRDGTVNRNVPVAAVGGYGGVGCHALAAMA